MLVHTVTQIFNFEDFNSHIKKNFLFCKIRDHEEEKRKIIKFNMDNLIQYETIENEIEDLVLKNNQTSWCELASEMLEIQHCCINISGTGYGKTPMVLWLALKYNFSVLVVCPPNVENVWRIHCRKYNVKV